MRRLALALTRVRHDGHARHRYIRLSLAGALVATALTLPAGTVATHTQSALLPDLVMLQPFEFRLERKPGGVRWLRFSTVIANIGDGPFDVYGYEPTGAPISTSSTLHVRQRIVETVDTVGKRTWVEHDAIGRNGTPSTMYYSGDGHDHWHVLGLQEWKLAYEATPDSVLETGAKTGFCFWDNYDLGWGAPKEYAGTWTCHPNADGSRVPMGQAVGWGDKYPSTIAGQYIDITKYPYGNYCLTLTADPRGEFSEKTAANNTMRTLISIQSGGVTVLAESCGEPDTTAPATPSGLTASGADQKVILDWSDNSEPDLAGYNVYYESGADRIATVTSSAHTDTGLSNGQRYCYEVAALDAAGNESPRSSPACATPAAESTTVTIHIGDLDGSAASNGRYWTATVVVTVHDSSEQRVSGADVSGSWSGGDGAVSQCTTGSDGSCSVASAAIPKSTARVSFSVTSIASEIGAHVSSHHHDPDGDSDGTTIIVSKP